MWLMGGLTCAFRRARIAGVCMLPPGAVEGRYEAAMQVDKSIDLARLLSPRRKVACRCFCSRGSFGEGLSG
jgi:hypothetical protein